jgi:hypothetical protein
VYTKLQSTIIAPAQLHVEEGELILCIRSNFASNLWCPIFSWGPYFGCERQLVVSCQPDFAIVNRFVNTTPGVSFVQQGQTPPNTVSFAPNVPPQDTMNRNGRTNNHCPTQQTNQGNHNNNNPNAARPTHT